MSEIKIDCKISVGAAAPALVCDRSADLASKVETHLAPRLSINPVAGETSGPALGLADETNRVCETEAISRSDTEMADENKSITVPTGFTEAEQKRATETVAANDAKAKAEGRPVEDLIPTTVKRGGYVLFHIRKRSGVKDPKTGVKPVTAAKFVWMPGAVGGSLDEFVAFFASKYADGDKAGGTTIFKKKALDAEVITIRSGMKGQTAPVTKKRGKTLV